ncbi:MAG: response regulator [Gallionella sp.]|nr:response regulator [Gallionella sp.]
MNAKSLNILLLEDDENDHLLIHDLLRQIYGAGFHLDWASSYAQGEQLVSARHYDIFLVDYQLGSQLTGVDWVIAIYKKLGGKCPPTILLTGQPDVQSIGKLARQTVGISYFLTKNELSAEVLERTIRFTLKNQAAMQHTPELVTILMADDDPDDRLLVEDAFAEIRLDNPLDFVENGVDLMDYLHRRGAYAHLAGTPLPGLILLDLNMPRKDGREALHEIKQDEKLRKIPIVILTTSKADEDLLASYELGANSFIVKPVTFDKLVEVIRVVTDYWLCIVTLPTSVAE